MWPLAVVSLLISQGAGYFAPAIATTTQWQSVVAQPISSVVALIILGLLTAKRKHLSLGLAFGGAFSNLLTYMLHGHAVDYLRIGTLVTNMADICIIGGLIWYAIAMFRLTESKTDSIVAL